jgi:hypothetical protein
MFAAAWPATHDQHLGRGASAQRRRRNPTKGSRRDARGTANGFGSSAQGLVWDAANGVVSVSYNSPELTAELVD